MRRHDSQSFGDGFASSASVTGVAAASGSRGAGQRGSSTPGVSGPPGLNWRSRCCSASPSRASEGGACAVAVPATANPANASAASRLIMSSPVVGPVSSAGTVLCVERNRGSVRGRARGFGSNCYEAGAEWTTNRRIGGLYSGSVSTLRRCESDVRCRCAEMRSNRRADSGAPRGRAAGRRCRSRRRARSGSRRAAERLPFERHLDVHVAADLERRKHAAFERERDALRAHVADVAAASCPRGSATPRCRCRAARRRERWRVVPARASRPESWRRARVATSAWLANRAAVARVSPRRRSAEALSRSDRVRGRRRDGLWCV